MRVGYVQVSIEGARATHDRIRGAGQFQLAVDAIRRLVDAGVRTLISFTAHRGNYREFADVAELGRRLKVSRVWADRLVPCGHGAELPVLSPEQTREFFGVMRRARDAIRRRWFNRTEVSMHRALQFLEGGSRPYRCTAGDTLLTVMPNGDLYPCRRMPVHVGNIVETPLCELYHGDFLRSLRDSQQVSKGCEACIWRKRCGGGLKCLSYAVTGDPFTTDPGCWLATGEGQDHDEFPADESFASPIGN
jgi:radical SAM protein with 4Fe4S-binding SPASM domain